MTGETIPFSHILFGPSLIFFRFVDQICTSLHHPQWRDSLPFGLGQPGGFLSQPFHQYNDNDSTADYLPKLPTYAQFSADNDLPFWKPSTFLRFAKTPSTSLAVLTTPDALIVLFTCVLLMRKTKAILIPFFCSVGADLGRSTHGREWEKSHQNQERIVKFGEYVFRLLYHFAVSVFGIWYFKDEAWWDEAQGGAKMVYVDHPYQPVKVGMLWYYMIQSAYNVEAMWSLLELSIVAKFQHPLSSQGDDGNRKWWIALQSPIQITWSPTCRGDFQEMFAHHVITNLLILGSSYSRFTRVGSMVFLVHDISDVPVDLSKLANFMKWKVTTVICFVLLMVVWAVTRLGILPFVVIKSAWFDSHIMYLEGTMDVIRYKIWMSMFHFLLLAITSLHLFWFAILLRIGYKLVTKGERHDLSEHKKGEEQECLTSSSNKKDV